MTTVVFEPINAEECKAAITFARNVCVIITDGHPLKIVQQRNNRLWLGKMQNLKSIFVKNAKGY